VPKIIVIGHFVKVIVKNVVTCFWRHRAKVTIDSLYGTEKLIRTKMNDLDLRIRLRSCQPLSHIRRWISRKFGSTVQRTTSRK